MPWHSVVINQPARLTRKHFSLAVEQEQTAYIPFEDIAVIVLGHEAITLTHPVLSACAEYGVGLFSTGKNFQPNGIFMPFLPHSRTIKVMRKQLGLSKPTAKRAWLHLVKAKINNQAECLALSDCTQADHLRLLSQQVRSGDPDNIEAKAAAVYFRALFGDKFNRDYDCRTNAALNYGYAVVRGAIARILVAHGFLPAFGLHHHSEQNAFNLADDLIEPFRPLVDLFTKNCIKADQEILLPADKAALVGLLHYDIAMAKEICSTLVAMEKCVMSLGRMLETSNPDIIEVPSLVGLNLHQNEC